MIPIQIDALGVGAGLSRGTIRIQTGQDCEVYGTGNIRVIEIGEELPDRLSGAALIAVLTGDDEHAFRSDRVTGVPNVDRPAFEG